MVLTEIGDAFAAPENRKAFLELMEMTRFISNFWLAALILTAGCASKPAPDPLAGWKSNYKHEPDLAIEKDYRGYIDKLPPQERLAARPADYLEDGTGHHAIVIELALNGQWWYHVLIYDQEDRRINVIKYSRGRYRS